MRHLFELKLNIAIAAALMMLANAPADAQIPDYFEEEQMWRTDQSSSDGSCAFYSENTYYIDSDTTIGQYLFKRVGIQGRSWQNSIGGGQGNCPSGINYFDELFCHIRQSNDSVFIRDWMLGNDGLLVSYNLTVGDTLYYFNQWYEVVQSIDTITINGSPHRQFNFDMNQQHYMIEGVVDIGYQSQSAPLFSNFSGMNVGPMDALCFSENDSTVWTNPWTQPNTCDYFIDLSLSDEINDPFTASIHPNPTSSILNIIINEPIPYSITLRDMTGKILVFERNVKQVAVGHLSTGTYLIEIEDLNSRRTFRDKIIVRH